MDNRLSPSHVFYYVKSNTSALQPTSSSQLSAGMQVDGSPFMVIVSPGEPGL